MRKKLFQITVIFVVAVSMMMVWRFFAGENGLWQQHKISGQISRLEAEADSLKQLLGEKQEEERRLQDDSFYIESLARTRFGMSKKGEGVYYFVPGGAIVAAH